MSKKTKIWLIVAFSLVLVGGLIFGGIMTMLNWDFTKLNTSKLVSNTHTVTEAFQNVSVTTDTADITFVPSQDGSTTVICQEFDDAQHAVSVENGTLVVALKNTQKWYQYIGLHFSKPNITVTLPQGAYDAVTIRGNTGDVTIPDNFTFRDMDITQSTGNVKSLASAAGTVQIKTSTGDIRVENASVGTLKLSVTTGKVTVSSVTCAGDFSLQVSTGKAAITGTSCRNLTSHGDTGSMALQNVIATEKFSIERSTGDVTFTDCDAAEIFVKTDTGDVTGNLLSEKVFIVETDTGKIDVPKSVTGGRCEIETDTGDIKITVK